MTPEQKQLVKDSWEKVLPIQETAASLFYDRLFDQHPEVKHYFKGDMQEQGEKLMKMLDQAVGSLDNIEALIEPLKQAGKAHKGYGVSAEDYDKVGTSLLWTLKQGLGDACTQEVTEAWTTTYQTLSSVMIDGAEYNESVVEPVQKKSIPWWRSLLGLPASS